MTWHPVDDVSSSHKCACSLCVSWMILRIPDSSSSSSRGLLSPVTIPLKSKKYREELVSYPREPPDSQPRVHEEKKHSMTACLSSEADARRACREAQAPSASCNVELDDKFLSSITNTRPVIQIRTSVYHWAQKQK